MNKKNMQQLKASVARDLIQGQDEHTATKDLLKQYSPLEGIVNTPRPKPLAPVEKSLAQDATVAPDDNSPCHGATVESPATTSSFCFRTDSDETRVS